MLNRIHMYIFIITVICSGYVYWKHHIEAQALMIFNQKQIEQVAKDAEIFKEKMAELESKQQEAAVNLLKQNEDVAKKLISLDTYLSSADTKKKDKPSSDILKNTIYELTGNMK